MLYIKKFIDKVSFLESKMNKDLIMPMTDARFLRDEISKLLTDLHELQSTKTNKEEVIKVEITGGKFK
jgi:hypothetical protein